MSNISTVQRLRTSARAQHTVSIGWRWIVAIILIIFSVFPILWMISASLNPTGSLATQKLIPDNPGFGNYRTLLTSGQFPFWTWFGNSLKVSIITSVLSLAITTIAALRVLALSLPRPPDDAQSHPAHPGVPQPAGAGRHLFDDLSDGRCDPIPGPGYPHQSDPGIPGRRDGHQHLADEGLPRYDPTGDRRVGHGGRRF